MTEAEELVYWMAFGSLGGARQKYVDKLIREYGSLKKAWEAPQPGLLSHFPRQKDFQSWISRREKRRIETYRDLLALCQREEIGVLTWTDPEYPSRLHDLEDPPMVLYSRGRLPIPTTHMLAIVGTRKPTHEGESRASELARRCAEVGVGVVSGLALGIDAAAHRGALEGQGFTAAILGSGLDQIYPPSHDALAEELASKGLLLSEYPPNFKVRAWSLKARNRIIAALADGVVVAEARETSGAYITARYARTMSRKLMALRPSDLTLPTSIGPERLIAQGAAAISDSEEVIAWFRALQKQPPKPQLTLGGSRLTEAPVEPINREEETLHEVLAAIASYLRQKNIDLKYLTDTKLNKWVYEVSKRLNLQITRSWYLRGSYVHSPEVSVSSLSRLYQHGGKDPSSDSIRRAVRDVDDKWRLVYTRGETFLERFYREEAPEEYRRVYLANLRATSELSYVTPLINSPSRKAELGDLDSWTRIETRLFERLSPALEELRASLAEREEFDEFAPVFEAYTFLVESVGTWLDRSRAVASDLPSSAKEVAVRILETYRSSVWRLPASKIAAQKAEGPRASELQRTMQRAVEDLSSDLRDALPKVANDWIVSIRPIEHKYRTMIRNDPTA